MERLNTTIAAFGGLFVFLALAWPVHPILASRVRTGRQNPGVASILLVTWLVVVFGLRHVVALFSAAILDNAFVFVLTLSFVFGGVLIWPAAIAIGILGSWRYFRIKPIDATVEPPFEQGETP
jgi:hypothetical protein